MNIKVYKQNEFESYLKVHKVNYKYTNTCAGLLKLSILPIGVFKSVFVDQIDMQNIDLIKAEDIKDLILVGTEFQIKVWQELLKIEPKKTISYLGIAQKIGKPKAVRTVANAIGANKIAYFIPCHQVIRTNGDLGGYAWGIDRKSKLLKLCLFLLICCPKFLIGAQKEEFYFNEELTKELIQEKTIDELNQEDDTGFTLIYYTIYNLDEVFAKKLIDKFFSQIILSNTTRNGETALTLAHSLDKIVVVKAIEKYITVAQNICDSVINNIDVLKIILAYTFGEKIYRCTYCSSYPSVQACINCNKTYCSSECQLRDWQRHKLHCHRKKFKW